MIPETIKKANLDLVGIDGNAFSIIAAVHHGLRQVGNTPEDIDAVIDEMMSADYDHLVMTAIEVCDPNSP